MVPFSRAGTVKTNDIIFAEVQIVNFKRSDKR